MNGLSEKVPETKKGSNDFEKKYGSEISIRESHSLLPDLFSLMWISFQPKAILLLVLLLGSYRFKCYS